MCTCLKKPWKNKQSLDIIFIIITFSKPIESNRKNNQIKILP